MWLGALGLGTLLLRTMLHLSWMGIVYVFNSFSGAPWHAKYEDVMRRKFYNCVSLRWKSFPKSGLFYCIWKYSKNISRKLRVHTFFGTFSLCIAKVQFKKIQTVLLQQKECKNELETNIWTQSGIRCLLIWRTLSMRLKINLVEKPSKSGAKNFILRKVT